MATRAQIIAGAFARIGLADYEFDVTPGERASARQKLDAMMAGWEADGVTLGHTADGGGNDAADMTTPAYADEAITDNLALRLAPDFGKAPSPMLLMTARRGYDLCSAKTLVVPTTKRGALAARGGGDRYYRRFGF